MKKQNTTHNEFSAEDEAQMLHSIDRWLERDVRPHVKKFDHVVHWGCNQFIDDLKHVQEGNPSSAIISILAHQHFDEWVIYKPYDLVPNYISPFEVGKRKQ